MVNFISKRNQNSNRLKDGKAFDFVNTLFMLCVMVITIYPFWYAFVVSIDKLGESNGLMLFPRQISFGAYQLLFNYDLLWSGYKNTIIRTVLGTTLSIIVTALTAYPLSKQKLPFRKIFTNYIIITMLFSGGMIPSYILIKQIGLLNSMWALVLPGMVSAYNVLIMRSFFMSIPESMEESARIDGAGWFRIWLVIILPLSKAVIATVGLWVLVGHWNAWFDAMIYIQDPNKTVLQAVLRKMVIEMDKSNVTRIAQSMRLKTEFKGKGLESAMIVISILPMLAIYPFLQKYFVKGIMLGSVKG